MIAVPELVEQRARSVGVSGRRWLEGLPVTLADLATEWQLTLGDVMSGGTASLVIEATEANGRACVLKVAIPFTDGTVGDFDRSVTAHRLAAGRGCVGLRQVDTDRSALLLERLGPNLHELGLAVDEVLDVIADTLASFWRPIAEASLPSGADAATRLAGFITETWSELGQPCERAVIDRAVRYCDERRAAFDVDRVVLVHGDAHGWNTLRAGDSYKLVDPEGLRSEREHDLGVPMREYNEPLLAGDTPQLVRARARRLADRCAADAEAVWQWGFIERVSTGLANVRDFDDHDASMAFLEVARRCL